MSDQNQQEETETIFGKTILVGLTYLNTDGNLDRQIQLHGPITELTSDALYFTRSDNDEPFAIPFDGELDTADPEAIYTLRSTGETVTGVYFTSSWTISPPSEDDAR